MRSRIARTSYRQAGRLVWRTNRGLRAGSVILRRDEAMEWHSTRHREELLILLTGRVRIDVDASAQITRWSLRAGECAFIPPETPHRVVNRSRTIARYLYVTAPTS